MDSWERGLETRLEKHAMKIVPPWFVCRFKDERWPWEQHPRKSLSSSTSMFCESTLSKSHHNGE